MEPFSPSKVTSNVTGNDTYVVLCDWHGQLVWKSATGDRLQIGDPLWKGATSKSTECLRAAIASVATLRETCTIEADNERGERFRLWMWPLNDPDIAVCVLAKLIPRELALLTDRERACLCQLAQGKSTRDIAKELDIGLTTVHTHLRRSREKLGLPSVEALISFAARYFYTPAPPTTAGPPAARKRSG
jgi:DNA-binding CsgD family transcriptional regulator